MLALEPTLEVLLVEDNPGDERLIQHYLGTLDRTRPTLSPSVHHAETLADGLDHLEVEDVDVVLLDLGLPDSTGLDTLQRVVDATRDVPVVVLTGSDDDTMAITAVQGGAQDYLVKGTIDGELLVRSLRYAIERKRNERELMRQNDRLEEFSSIVSHDLRNPLTVAMGRVQVEREERESENLDHAADALERMEELISEVLALARQGATIGETRDVDLTEFVDRAWQMVRTEHAALRVRPGLGTVEADPNRLSELLENLLGNAIRHGGGDVIVTVDVLEDGSGFFVEDDGPGIPVEDRVSVFEPGYTTDHAGTGFGLTIVKNIVDAQGWTIRVADGENGGARFEIGGVEYQTA